MVISKVLAAALAQKAARSQGASPQDASRAAAIATLFPNPLAGLVVARAIGKPRDQRRDPTGSDKVTAMAADSTAEPEARSTNKSKS